MSSLSTNSYMYGIKGRLPLMDKVSEGIDRGSSYTHTP